MTSIRKKTQRPLDPRRLAYCQHTASWIDPSPVRLRKLQSHVLLANNVLLIYTLGIMPS